MVAVKSLVALCVEAGSLSFEAYSSLFKEYSGRYAAVKDGPSQPLNDGQQWESSLSLESVSTLPCIRALHQACQKAQEMLVPKGRERESLKLSNKSSSHSSGSKPPFPAFASKSNPVSVGQPNRSRPQEPSLATHQSTVSKTFAPVTENKQQHFQRVPKDVPDGFRKTQHGPTNGMNFSSGTEGKERDTGGSFWNLGSNRSSSHPQEGWRPDLGESGKQDSLPAYRRPQPNQSLAKQKSAAHIGLTERDEGDNSASTSRGQFRTAKEQLAIENQKKYGRGGVNGGGGTAQSGPGSYGTSRKSLGTRRGPASKFVPPVLNREEDDGTERGASAKASLTGGSEEGQNKLLEDERLKNVEPKMIELITSEIMDLGPPVAWEDIAGLEFAKKTIKEIVIWPMLRPDIFTGLRGPPKGLLLFGPPGTGKTLIGKCIACQSKSTFFSISASSLTSKWVGEGEKMVRALFAVARVYQPAVVFIDEIDSLLSQRSDNEHESSRRIKTEFLVQLDGATTGENDRILVVGATNRPQEIDEAARRRFVKRLYIPLPEEPARRQIVVNLMGQQSHQLTEQNLQTICIQSDGYSGSDMANLCREAALGPIRSMPFEDIENITAEQVRPIQFCDFEDAFRQVRASVSEKDLDLYLDWNKQYGSWGM